MAPKGKKRTSSEHEGGSKKKKGKAAEPMAAPPRNADGKAFYLVKRQAEQLSVEDLERAPNQTAAISGLRNTQAKEIIQTMQEGDEVYLYSTVKGRAGESAISAICSVARAPYPDPTAEPGKGWLAVDLKLEEALDPPIPLADLKKHSEGDLAGWSLFSNSLLPVHWLTEEQFNFVDGLADQEGAE